MGLFTESDDGLSRPYEKLLAAIPLVMLLAFGGLIAYFGSAGGDFDCPVDAEGHVVPTKVVEGSVELGSGSAFLAAEDGTSAWVAGGCGRRQPGCQEAYSTLAALRHQRVRVGLCGTRALFIDADGRRLLEDRSTLSSYRRSR
jgi:hypothetical protein